MHIFAQIASFGFKARSAAFNAEHLNLYTSVFKPIHVLLKALRKKLAKKKFFDTP